MSCGCGRDHRLLSRLCCGGVEPLIPDRLLRFMCHLTHQIMHQLYHTNIVSVLYMLEVLSDNLLIVVHRIRQGVGLTLVGLTLSGVKGLSTRAGPGPSNKDGNPVEYLVVKEQRKALKGTQIKAANDSDQILRSISDLGEVAVLVVNATGTLCRQLGPL